MAILSSLKARLVLVLIVAAVPVVALVSLNLADEYRLSVAEARGQLAAVASGVAGHQASILGTTHDLLLSLASRRSVDDQDVAACDDELVRFGESTIGVLSAGIIGTDDEWLCSTVPARLARYSFQDRPWFQDAMASDALAIGGYQIGRVTGKPSINLALAVHTARGRKLIAFVALDLSWFQRTLLSRVELLPDSYLLVVDHSGTVVTASSAAVDLVGKSIIGMPIGQALRAGRAGYVEIDDQGVPVLAAVDSVALGPKPDLIVIVAIPVRSIAARPLAHFYGNLATVLGTTALVLILAWFIAERGVARPIARISAGAARLGQGETGVRVGSPGTVREIAALGRGFDTMAAELEARDLALTEAAREMRAALDRLNAVIEASPAAIIGLDRGGNVTLWNPAAERLFGLPAEDAIGKPHPVVPASERGHFTSRFEMTLAGQSVIGERATRMKKDGTLVEVVFNSGPLHDEAGRRIGVLYVVVDLTSQIETERQLLQAQKMESVGQLTGGIAHDFNNLLGVAVGNLDLVMERTGDASIRELIDEAFQACLRGAELTRQLLAFSRRQPLRPEPIEPEQIIRAITRLLDRTLGDGITLNLDTVPGLWRITADPTQLESAILNLAVNARDAMPKGGTLMIELQNARIEAESVGWDREVKPGDYVQITVSDTGTGMPPDVLARAFDPFFTTKETGRGTGLGLSMVYGFIKQSGGHIMIYSEPGHGTTIKLWLPRSEAAESARLDGRNEPLDVVPHGTETILVVEDNVAIRRVVVRQLTSLGYRTIEAQDGPSALGILDSRDDIDLLFTDVMMPSGMDGRELAVAALGRRPGLRVLYTSGFSEHLGIKIAEVPLAGPLLSKPYRKQQLAEALRAVLGGA